MIVFSLEMLGRILPRCPGLRLATCRDPLNASLAECLANTPGRASAYLAQLAHESGQFRWFREWDHSKPIAGCRLCRTTGKGHAAGAQYEGRRDLGNISPGDGVRYIGRGAVQLTGRANYEAASTALGVDLATNPDRAEGVDLAFRIAAWFWSTRRVNALADEAAKAPAPSILFDEVTRKINGGLNGKAERDAFYIAARRELGMDGA